MIHIHRFLTGYDPPFVQKYQKILEFNEIPYKMVNSQSRDFWEEIQKSELLLMHLGQAPMHLHKQTQIVAIVDKYLGIPCFPDWNTAWHFDDKIGQQLLLESRGFPVIQGYLFSEKKTAMIWANNTRYPKVFKLKGGAGSLNVVKVNDSNHAIVLINKMFGKGIKNSRIPNAGLFTLFSRNLPMLLKNIAKEFLYETGLRFSSMENWSIHQGYAYFQDFVPNNDFDTRITVIGGCAFGFIRESRTNDFRSSGSGKIDYSRDKVNLEMVDIALRISGELSFNSMAYDFLLDENKNPVITEMSCEFADYAINRCPGYWDVKLNWHAGHYWPQFLQLKSLLEFEQLKQPELS